MSSFPAKEMYLKNTNKNIFEIEKTYAETGGNLQMDFFPNPNEKHLCGSLATGDHVHQRLEEGACVAWFLLVTWFINDANIFGIYLSTYPSI